MAVVFKCKMCGGDLDIEQGSTVATCQYCGAQQTLPRLDDDRRANMYDRANHFRRGNEFDKAAAIYETILNEDGADAEAYWSLVLCKYGVEYVEDPATRRRVPTCNRTQYTSVLADGDYKQAIANADSRQKTLYELEAREIDAIQKGILEISNREAPFDIFICYKETDENGRRTPDSVLAQDLYHQLTNEGYKVFFSRITLEDKLGSAYEPYIFAALQSSKVMVVVGTKAEHFNAVWVKNEWSRYLALIKDGAKKTLVPAYRDMDPYNLPDEFSHLQSQDMSKLGFMQDLVRGVRKLVEADAPKQTASAAPVVIQGGAGSAEALVKRAYLSLEDADWTKAAELFDQALNLDPENAEAYVGLLCAELKVKTESALAECAESFAERANYKKAVRFGNEQLKARLEGYNQAVADILEREQIEQLEHTFNEVEMLPEKTIGQINIKLNKAKELQESLSAASNLENTETLSNSCGLLIGRLSEQSEGFQNATKRNNKYKSALRLLTISSFVAMFLNMDSRFYYTGYRIVFNGILHQGGSSPDATLTFCFLCSCLLFVITFFMNESNISVFSWRAALLLSAVTFLGSITTVIFTYIESYYGPRTVTFGGVALLCIHLFQLAISISWSKAEISALKPNVLIRKSGISIIKLGIGVGVLVSIIIAITGDASSAGGHILTVLLLFIGIVLFVKPIKTVRATADTNKETTGSAIGGMSKISGEVSKASSKVGQLASDTVASVAMKTGASTPKASAEAVARETTSEAHCKSCGAALAPSDAFCQKCGAKVE